jgi:acylphosphatase
MFTRQLRITGRVQGVEFGWITIRPFADSVYR